MAVVRWDPVREMVLLRDAVDKLFQDAFVPPVGWGTLAVNGAQPMPVDLYHNDQEIVVKATAPGVNPNDLQVTVEQGHLIIKGEVKPESEIDGTYLIRERRPAAFARAIPLPSQIDDAKIEASIEHGVLTVKLPKAEAVKPKQIKIRAH